MSQGEGETESLLSLLLYVSNFPLQRAIDILTKERHCSEAQPQSAVRAHGKDQGLTTCLLSCLCPSANAAMTQSPAVSIQDSHVQDGPLSTPMSDHKGPSSLTEETNTVLAR